jgi:hypothetical protein
MTAIARTQTQVIKPLHSLSSASDVCRGLVLGNLFHSPFEQLHHMRSLGTDSLAQILCELMPNL